MNALFEHYADFKRALGEGYGLSEDLLHVHAGLVIFFAAALLFHRRMRSWVPIALVYFFAIANEVIDLLSPDNAAGIIEPLADILNTVLWPTLLFLLAHRQARRGDPDKTA